MKSLFVSFFNSANLGDCLLADSLYNVISKEFETTKYSYSGDPTVVTDLNNIKDNSTAKKRNMKGEIYDRLKKMNFTAPIILYKTLKKDSNTHKEFKEKLKEVEVLIIGGGNMIFDKDEFSDSASHFNSYVTIAKEYNKKIFAISLGIGPFQTTTQEKKAVQALQKCDYISFRDKTSYDIYKKYTPNTENVYITVDPVFSLPSQIDYKLSSEKTIGLNIFDIRLITNDKKEYAKLIKAYTKLTNFLVEKLEVRVILFSTDLKDYQAVNDVIKEIKDPSRVEVRNIEGVNSLLEMYSDLSILIGTRMHSMIIAYTQRIPLVGISWQPKVDAFFEIIQSKQDMFNCYELGNHIDKIKNLCEYKLDNLEDEKIKIENNLKVIKISREVDTNILLKIKERF